MKKQVYSIYDKKAMFYGPLMVYDNRVSALRDFEQVCLNSQAMINKYPDDFVLYYVGTFETENGRLEPCLVPQHIMEAREYLPEG